MEVYRKGNWIVMSECLTDGSRVYYVHNVGVNDSRIDAVNLNAAIQIAECLTKNAV